ncbi:MAG: 4Fe-4S binding protein [Candidatus Hodarchaeales archaeon]|jgi:formate hydrogenlyase subunit 6/NADH:ubiquinone oxidoreductase subunit I
MNLLTFIGNLIKPKSTVMFPSAHVPIPEGFRGFPFVIPENCTGCKQCISVCPSGALEIIDTEDGGRRHITDIGRCTRCQQCEESCQDNAIHLTVQEVADILRADVAKGSMVQEVQCLAYTEKTAK